MELEKWIKNYDIKNMIMRDLELYLSEYKKDNEEDFNELFKDMILEEVKYKFHSVSYVINTWHAIENEERKYISAKVRLEYENNTFAEYEAIYNLYGEGEDDYLRMV